MPTVAQKTADLHPNERRVGIEPIEQPLNPRQQELNMFGADRRVVEEIQDAVLNFPRKPAGQTAELRQTTEKDFYVWCSSRQPIDKIRGGSDPPIRIAAKVLVA
jgi:hypothetical protein